VHPDGTGVNARVKMQYDVKKADKQNKGRGEELMVPPLDKRKIVHRIQ
jgi:hypothetical protein